MNDGGREPLWAEDEVVSAAETRRFEECVRGFEPQLDRKTPEREILQEALERTRAKKVLLPGSARPGPPRSVSPAPMSPDVSPGRGWREDHRIGLDTARGGAVRAETISGSEHIRTCRVKR